MDNILPYKIESRIGKIFMAGVGDKDFTEEIMYSLACRIKERITLAYDDNISIVTFLAIEGLPKTMAKSALKHDLHWFNQIRLKIKKIHVYHGLGGKIKVWSLFEIYEYKTDEKEWEITPILSRWVHCKIIENWVLEDVAEIAKNRKLSQKTIFSMLCLHKIPLLCRTRWAGFRIFRHEKEVEEIAKTRRSC